MAAGIQCPKCKKLTFITTLTGRKCTKCGFVMTVSPGSGKGTKCSNCGKFMVFNGKRRGCGATYSG